MTRALVWIFILWKRLFKKKGFIIALALIPLMSFLLSSVSGDGGFLNIAVSYAGEAGADAAEKVLSAEADSGILKLLYLSDPDEAVSMAQSGKADAAWIFESESAGNYKVSIYQREENIFLKLAREKVFCTLFPDISYAIYSDFTTEKMLPDKALTDGELRAAYDGYTTDDTLVEIYSKEGEAKSAPDYLTTPLRGLSAILMLMCGMAATVYHLTDENGGSFSLLGRRGRFGVLMAGNLCALSTASLFVTLSLILSGNYTDFISESIAMMMFIITSALFCTFLGSFVRRIEYFAVLLPVVLVLSLAFCPIFINNIKVPTLQYLLPVYHYMYAVGDPSRLWHMLIYASVALPLAYICYVITRKQTA